MNKIGKLVVIAMASAVSSAAFADFSVENLDAQQVKRGVSNPAAPSREAAMVPFSTVAPTAGVSQIGAPRGVIGLTKGFAKEVSILTALKQIVPEGWHAKKAGDVDVSRVVSWKGDGRTWVEILHGLGISYNFAAVIDWDRKELTVSPAGGAVFQARESKQVAQEPAAPKSWTLKTELTLKENVEAWAKTSGWNVSWGAVDYPISVPVTLVGELDEEGGPLHQLSEAYRAAEQPLVFSFKSLNRVIRVENAIYKPLPQKDELATHRSFQQ